MRQRRRDDVFETLFFVETGSPYSTQRGRAIPRTMLGAINKAVADAKACRYSADDLVIGIRMWPRLMDNATITANALVKWMPRLLLVADGASFRANPQADSDRLASESMRRAVERLRDEGKVQ